MVRCQYPRPLNHPGLTLHISLWHTNVPVISGCIACAQEHIYVLYAVPVSSVAFMILKATDERMVGWGSEQWGNISMQGHPIGDPG